MENNIQNNIEKTIEKKIQDLASKNVFKYLNIKIKSCFVEVSLNRPDVRNSFNKNLIQELKIIFSELGSVSEIRAIVFKGEGKVFCAGADLEMMKQMVNFSLEQNQNEALEMYDMFQAIYQCPIPVITVAHGAAFGGALGLLAASDIVICEEKTQLCFSEVKLGLVPAVISHFLTKKISHGFLTSLMITGKLFTAQQALQMGLVHEVANATELETILNSYLELFKQSGPRAVQASKKLLQYIENATSESVNEKIRKQCSQVIAERRVSDEGQEGLKSFLEKRPCTWKLN